MFDYLANATVVNPTPTKSTHAQKIVQITEAYRFEVRFRATSRSADTRALRSA